MSSAIPRFIQIQFSDFTIMNIPVSLIYFHYQKQNTENNTFLTKEQFFSDTDFILKFATEKIAWSQCIYSARQLIADKLPDFAAEWKTAGNKIIVFEEVKQKDELEKTGSAIATRTSVPIFVPDPTEIKKIGKLLLEKVTEKNEIIPVFKKKKKKKKKGKRNSG